MADFSKSKPSKRFEDHTGYGKINRLVDFIFTSLNPVTAARNVRGSLIENGIVKPKEKRLRPLADFKNEPSKNFIDKTGFDGEMVSRLDNMLSTLTYGRDSQASFMNSIENAWRHKYPVAPPYTKGELMNIMFGPFSVEEMGGGIIRGKSLAPPNSPYYKQLLKEDEKAWKKSYQERYVDVGL